MRLLAGVAFAAVCVGPLAAQAPTPSPARTATPSAAAAGLVAKPKWGQGPDQQRQSEAECYARASRQTGIDPIAADSVERARKAATDSAARGAVAGRRTTRDSALRAEGLMDFRKAMRACLETGGYSVE